MKKVIAVTFLFIVASVFGNSSVVYAEETCSYKKQAELNKIAASVTASYDIEKQENGTSIFKISVYNITKDIYVSVLSEDETYSLTIIPDITTNGTYTFAVANETDIIKYNFVVRGLDAECTGDIKKFSLIKPKRNKYHDYNECKFSDTENYSYCKEWITNDFSISEKEILAKIKEQRNNQSKITTTKCVDCATNVRDYAKKEKIKLLKKILVIIISICISFDIVYTYIKACRIKDSEI